MYQADYVITGLELRKRTIEAGQSYQVIKESLAVSQCLLEASQPMGNWKNILNVFSAILNI